MFLGSYHYFPNHNVQISTHYWTSSKCAVGKQLQEGH